MREVIRRGKQSRASCARDDLANCDAVERYTGVLADSLADSFGCCPGCVLGLKDDHSSAFSFVPYPVPRNKAWRLLRVRDDLLPQVLLRRGPVLDRHVREHSMHSRSPFGFEMFPGPRLSPCDHLFRTEGSCFPP